MSVGIVILNYNSAADTERCIQSLLGQTGCDCEIIVVDNSTDPQERALTEDLCSRFNCSYLPADENRGYNAGNNIGLRYCTEKGHRYALVCNPDMIIKSHDYCATLVKALEEHPEACAVGSKILTPEGLHQNPRKGGKGGWINSFEWVGQMLKGNKTEPVVGNVPAWVDTPEESHFSSYLNGSCIMLDMEWVREIGYFDEDTFLYGEEAILGRQAELTGRKMFYTADTEAIHDHKKSREGSSRFTNYYWRRSRRLYIDRYSQYPWYGKVYARLANNLYFFTINTWHRLHKRR